MAQYLKIVFEECNFESVSLVGFDKVTCESYDVLCNVKPNNKIPIYGMFKGCFCINAK